MIVLENVSRSYDGKNYVVNGINLTVAAGELLVFLGGSGCGKTTTLKMINRLIEPGTGRIIVDGCDVRSTDPVQLRRKIGYVFQGIGLFPHLTVGENVAVVPRLLGWREKDIGLRVEELLNLVGLPASIYRDRLPVNLSGGQQQRVGFARALAARPRVILLDEPFGALDPLTRDEVREEFLRLRREQNLTAVLVTHDMTEALLSADRIAVMNDGKIVGLGTPRQLLAAGNNEFVSQLLGTPRRQARQLEALIAGQDGGQP